MNTLYKNKNQQAKILSLQSHKLMLVAKAAGIGTWEYNIATHTIVADEVTLLLYDMPLLPEVKCFEVWMNIVHPDDREKVRHLLLAVLKKDSIETILFRIIKQDGNVRYIEMEAMAYSDDTRAPVYVTGTCRNVAHDETIDLQVKEREQWHHHMFSQNLAGFYQATIEGVIINCNPAFSSMLKYDVPADLIGTNIKELFFSSSFYNYCIEQLLHRAGIYNYEGSLLCKDGSPIYFLENVLLQTDAESGEKIINGTIVNITERQKDRQKLIGTSLQLQHAVKGIQKVMDFSLDVICTLDVNGNFLEVSAACELMWGYKPRELKGKPYIELVYKEDIEKTMFELPGILNGKPITVFENRHVRKDGTVVPMLWSARWEEKEKRLYGIGKDIKEKKRLEKEYEIERQRFHDLFLHAPSSMGKLKGPDYVFEMANALYLQLIGKENIIGKRIIDIMPELAEQGLIDVLDKVYRTGETFSAKEMLVRMDRKGNGVLEDLYLNLICQPHKNSEDEVEGILFFIIDVTEQVMARKKIEDSERRYREIVETAQEGIWQMDEENIICFTNDKMCAITGYSYDEIIDSNIAFFLGEDGIQLADALQKKQKKEGANHCHLTLKNKHGKEIWIHISANALYHKNGIYKGFLIMATDITESKETDLSNRFKADLLNTIGQAVMATDLNGIILYWNKAAEQIFGWTEEETIGRHILNHGPAKESEEIAITGFAELKTGKKWWGEMMMQRKNGDVFPAFITDAPFYDEHNNITGIIGVATDISERKMAEVTLKNKTEELQKANEQQAAILNALPPHIALLNSNGIIFLVNDSWKQFGRENGEENQDTWVGQNYIEISNNATGADLAYGKTIAAKIRDVISGRIGSFSMDYSYNTLVAKKWFNVVVSPLMNKVGEGAVVLHIDITDKIVAEQELRNQQEQLIASQKISQIGSWQINFYNTLDIDTNYFLCSEVTYRIFGFAPTQGEISYSVFENQIYSTDRALVKSTFIQAITGVSPFSIDFRIVHKKGSVRWVHQEAKIMTDAQTGNPVVMFGTVKDITANKEQQLIIEKNTEERIQIVNDLMQRNKDLEQFTYIVSHNLRLPVANILGMSEILQDETISPKEKEELGQGLMVSVKKLDNVVQDLNDILQIKQNSNVGKEKVYFTELVEDIRLSIKNLITDADITIAVDVSQVNAMITLKSYLYSIFYNLISNSLKYRRHNAPCLIRIQSVRDNNNLQLIFSDNGTGIDLEKRGDEMFGLYKRFHNQVEGKGMGLFMVKTQVEALGGRISVQSTINEGTTFLIEFLNYYN